MQVRNRPPRSSCLLTIVQSSLHYSNKNIKMSSFKSGENIQKKEGGPDRSVLDNQSSSVTLNELTIKARKNILLFQVSAKKSYTD